jgi:tRNA 2-thiouridine synthesizing protein A
MSRTPWLGRSTGRHAAPGRGRAKAARGEQPPEPEVPGTPALAAGGGLLGAPTFQDATPDAAAPLTSPVTDAARAASAATAAMLPAHVPPGDEPVVTIDALGRKCPIPIIMLAEQIRDVPVGAVIAVLADDPAAYSDIPAWCGLKSHDCVFRAGYADGWSFGVRRRY